VFRRRVSRNDFLPATLRPGVPDQTRPAAINPNGEKTPPRA
jgi:hypothetical protein